MRLTPHLGIHLIPNQSLLLQRCELSKEEKRKEIRVIKYINVDEAKMKFTNCLFNSRAPLYPDVLQDDNIFKMLKEGLTEKQVVWVTEKRKDLLRILEEKVSA